MTATNLTALETKVFNSFIDDDFIGDLGIEDPDAATWVDGIAEDTRIRPTSLSGVMASLSKKNLIWTNGESCGFTDKGREVAVAMRDAR